MDVTKQHAISRRIETLAVIAVALDALQGSTADGAALYRDALLRAQREIVDAPVPPDTTADIGDLSAIVARKREAMARATDAVIAQNEAYFADRDDMSGGSDAKAE